VLNVPESKIDIINLETHDILQVNLTYLFDDTVSMELHTFSDSKYFAVVEFGGLNDSRLRLTYFDYSGINEKSQPLTQWDSKENEWTYDHTIGKLNNHSKIGWWTFKHEQEVSFVYYDLKDSAKGKFQTVKAVCNIGNQYGINNLSFGVAYLWETRPNVYMIAAITNKFEHKDKGKDKNGVFNNNYVLDASHGNDQGTIRETKFVFEIANDGFGYNEQTVDCFGIGPISVFHTFRHEKGQVLETPIYYINNETEEIVSKETWKSTCFASRFFFPGWDGSVVVQSEHQNGDCDYIVITAKKVMDPKEISMHFLLHLNPDFDDDLLQDAIDLLH